MTISVIIPTFNTAEYLDICLESLQKTAPDVEAIVVSDGSTDNTEEVCKKYPNVNFYAFKENKGQSLAFNYAVAMATGSHVLIFNDDMVFPKEWKERVETFANNSIT